MRAPRYSGIFALMSYARISPQPTNIKAAITAPKTFIPLIDAAPGLTWRPPRDPLDLPRRRGTARQPGIPRRQDAASDSAASRAR
ncbi:hypothetical protein JCM18909_2072 [Cutibacterium acnes JCM 18909]|nr:hypothetical protein JCM18909_2072 [Cutibacterium acnes JCM 18909]